MADVDTAGESRLAVHNKNFAVIAKIESRHAPRREQRRRQEFCERNLRVLQFASDGRPRVASSRGINQNAHCDFTSGSAGERIGKLFAAGIVVADVSDKRNGFCRGFNRGKHGRKGLVAIDERSHAVAGCQRLGDDAADDARQHFQVLHVGELRFAQAFRNGTDDGFMHAEQYSAAADAVHAEGEVENRAKNRQEPDSSEPECSGARIALVEQRVHRGEQRCQKMTACYQVRPELGNCVEPVYRRDVLKEAGTTQATWT